MRSGRSSRVRAHAACLGTCAALLSNHVFAQATAADKAAAEALFEQGIDLLKAGKLTEACARLEQSESIERGIGTSLYLAECYEKQGRTASAWGLFRDAASEAQARGESERAQQGRARAARIEPRLSRLTVSSTMTEKPAGLQILRDADPVPDGLWNVAVPVDPGEHRITARAPGYVEWSQVVRVDGDAASVSVNVPPLVRDTSVPLAAASTSANPAATSPLPEEDGGQSSSAGNTQRTIGIVTGGVGVVALGIGGFFGLRAISKNNDAKDHCNGGTICSDRDGVTLTDDAKSAANVANVLVIGGAVLVAGGLTLYFTAPSGTERTVAFASDGRGARLVMGGAF
jgi:serine/threonine-protein kinase